MVPFMNCATSLSQVLHDLAHLACFGSKAIRLSLQIALRFGSMAKRLSNCVTRQTPRPTPERQSISWKRRTRSIRAATCWKNSTLNGPHNAVMCCNRSGPRCSLLWQIFVLNEKRSSKRSQHSTARASAIQSMRRHCNDCWSCSHSSTGEVKRCVSTASTPARSNESTNASHCLKHVPFTMNYVKAVSRLNTWYELAKHVQQVTCPSDRVYLPHPAARPGRKPCLFARHCTWIVTTGIP